MMTNLFSSFDPSTSNLFNLNWMSTMISLIFIPLIFWLIPSRITYLWNKITITLHKEFNILMNTKGTTLLLISLFSLILINNVISLFPFIFSSTSHLTFTLTFSLPLWLSFMIYGWINNTNHMFTHLVPQGTPSILIPFMVCIETVSNIIRPMTLAIRLTANMTAGHLLLTLLGNSGPTLEILLTMLIIAQLMLLILESAVALIQAYVFSILMTLYSSEV
uniref:ATP synthase subunit a n=1 Tax=Eucnemidae sp. 4 ACP-2013 TaxID=1434503 RepID=A0A3G4RYC7_9COLE|nr:ATP synthase F0 subunit 6 [Eucnemidae sp. 4 ACP-2013]